MASFEDQVAVVTGGGTGIGRSISLRLARDGADVVLACPEQDEMRETAEGIRSLGRRALTVVTDICHEDQINAMIAQTREEMGRIDILVNNSGIAGPTAPATDVALEDWDCVMAVNLTGAFLCAKAIIPDMTSRRSGKIVNISSIAGKIGYALRIPYAVSKWGIIGLTLSLAKELGPHNIQVNAICPGPVAGPRIQEVIQNRARELGQSQQEVEQSYLNEMALGRFVQPDDVAAMVAFLASSQADNITGEAIDVSAGYSL